MKGKIIVIEGIDASGKGTQTKRLVEYLLESGKTVGTLDFPAYDRTPFGKIVGNFLNGDFCDPVAADPFATTLLFSGDRLYERERIKELVETHDYVILNRYVPSNIAYSCAKLRLLGRENEIVDFIHFNTQLEYELLRLPKPDHVIVLDVSTDQADKQINTKGDREYIKDGETRDKYETNRALQREVVRAYHQLAKGRDSWSLLNCTGKTRDEVFELIKTCLTSKYQ
jgi:dTMP kinase